MRLLLTIIFALPLAVATGVEAARGNPLALGMAAGALGMVAFVVSALAVGYLMRPKPLPHKADPAKIRQMEHELGIEAQHDPLTCAFCRVAEKAAAHSRRTDDAPTTVATFHGAPTFGHPMIASEARKARGIQ